MNRDMRRVLGVAFTVAALATVPGFASQAGRSPAAISAAATAVGSCGVERWTIKTLQDRARLIPTRRVSLHYLVTRPRPYDLPATRLPFERRVFTVTDA